MKGQGREMRKFVRKEIILIAVNFTKLFAIKKEREGSHFDRFPLVAEFCISYQHRSLILLDMFALHETMLAKLRKYMTYVF